MNYINKLTTWALGPFYDFIVGEDNIQEKTLNNKSVYRPITFNEYIGQKKAKEILSNYITGCEKLNNIFPHTLIHGNAGMGKTTLALIIANCLKTNYHITIGSEIENKNDITRKIKLVDGGILFIDEIHSIDRNICELFYPIMEDFREVKPFTLIGATTELGEIIKNRKPFLDRFKIILELENYNIIDLIKIASQYNNKVFNDSLLTNQEYELLAKNCRNNPRYLIRLLEASIYFDKDIKKVLKSYSILKDGFTEIDYKILKYLKNNEKGLGLNSIASYLNTSEESYLYFIEPYLIQKEAIIRTARGRKITEKGLELIKELEND